MLDDEEIARRYRMAPAAKQIHHAFLGGLIEHVLSVCGLAKCRPPRITPTSIYDLLLTGVMLHDIGKIYELNYERGFSLLQRRPVDRPHHDRACAWWATNCAALPDFRRCCARWWST